MALIREEWCNFCKANRIFTDHECNVCYDRKVKEKWLIWNNLSNEDKINKLLERIEKLEAGPARY